MNTLSLNNISVNYGQVPALRGVSISVEEKSIVTLIGANGAGKSTALRSISGLMRIKSGEILFFGKRIDTLPAQKIVELGIAHCPEGRRIFGDASVLENLKAGAFLQKEKRKIEEAKERVFDYFPVLKDRTRQRAGTLSGGEQQMLAIGRALMSDPRFLILDEPSLGLAPKLVREIAFIVKEINRKGIPVLLVEQNAQMALRVSDFGYVLETGKIVLDGPSIELLSNDFVVKSYLGGGDKEG